MDNKKDKKNQNEEKSENNTKAVIKRKIQGVVVSNKMNKTLVVKVDQVKTHPKYKKRYTVSKKYKVHDGKEMFREGDKVVFVECRPLSKDKCWRVVYENKK